MDYPIKVAFIWHMHQPYYKDLITGEYLLPWVRLHATKDYYDMAAILEDFPSIRQTFNLVPSLLVQIEEYGRGEACDKFLLLSQKSAAELTFEDKRFILSNFFMANWENMIKPFPRYWELLHKRGLHCSDEQIKGSAGLFSSQDFLDLQALFNLCWFDPYFFNSDPFLLSMKEKGRGFTEKEKGLILEKQRDISARVAPLYKKMMERGQIDITTTPFYHPILPLLCDTGVAARAMPNVKLPERPFIHPEDAAVQVDRAVSYHKKLFGRPPKGIWPSEGSVSTEALRVIASAGLSWAATDEEILEASADMRVRRGAGGVPENPEFLYRPYLYRAGEKDIAILFRDHHLYDLIGFVYSSWAPEAAAHDFIHKLHDIGRSLGDRNKNGDYIVPVILDGENCWEHYLNDGRDFLTKLYALVEGDPLIEMVTVSEHLEDHPPAARLNRIWPGSWINHNFKIWIGHEEDNRAWDLLKLTRDELVRAEKEGGADPGRLYRAWEHIYIAEGSDWCWWYGDDHGTENDADFDNLFRKNLINVYTLINKMPPAALFKPIIKAERHIEPFVEATSYIHPTIDGEVTSYFEWLGAAVIELGKQGGAMHKATDILSYIYYRFDEKSLYIRLDKSADVEEGELKDLFFSILLSKADSLSVEIVVSGDGSCETVCPDVSGSEQIKATFSDIVEAEVPLSLIDFKSGEEIDLSVAVKSGGGELERWPAAGYFTIKFPDKDFESKVWNAYA